MIVVVATKAPQAQWVARQLRAHGAEAVTEQEVGRGRVLLYGSPFDDRRALEVAAGMRALGWPADVRPVGGGHLAAWRAHTRPDVIDGRLWVCLPWSEFDRAQAEILVEIDPGRAFGTGAHPTTRLLLHALAARIQGGESVLDVGCGSGVLAIAAAALGAREVLAIDVSPAAVAATKANAARNRWGERVVAVDTPVAQLTTRFEVIVANVDAATLVQLAPALQRCLAPGGWLGLSGLSPAQLSIVAAAYGDVTVVASPIDDDWAALIATRPAKR